ncbi:hypothetical protein NA57DRAFT_59417 [Rhizodiscina lignyota]|uniref:Uncharacterized protein n=1 Tax=Rhizodiscina lignyota TaxID=1504668 RepID=A0A9P4I8G6_9PEZI|nr:hypothetical protein NA57DRAFT_59417 [Rhizodiscina lignyota]
MSTAASDILSVLEIGGTWYYMHAHDTYPTPYATASYDKENLTLPGTPPPLATTNALNFGNNSSSRTIGLSTLQNLAALTVLLISLVTSGAFFLLSRRSVDKRVDAQDDSEESGLLAKGAVEDGGETSTDAAP